MQFEIVNSNEPTTFKSIESLTYFYLRSPNKPYLKLPGVLQTKKGKEVNAISLVTKAYVYMADDNKVYRLYDFMTLQTDPIETKENDPEESEKPLEI